MKTRSSASHSRTPQTRRGGTSWLAAGASIGFALVPLAVLAWGVRQTGIGFA